VPATSARSPRATACVARQAFWVNVTGLQAGMAACGMVAVWLTVAMLLVTVIVTVRLVLATWTVTVCAAGVGVSMAAAVDGLPASSDVAGVMLPDPIACRAAPALAVSARRPAIEFQNVSNSMAGLRALTASAGAARQAMGSGNMTPATSLLAGNPSTAAAMLTPTPAAQTVTVQVANTNLTVTITVTRSMATVNQTATMPQAAMPAWSPVTFTQNAWRATHAVARGDLALVAGTRSHRTLHAQLVLFAPLSAATPGKAAGGNGATPVVMPTAVATHW